MSALSRTAARAVLTEARRIYRSEITAARKFNPGSADHQLRERAGAAALRRVVSWLERSLPADEHQPLDQEKKK